MWEGSTVPQPLEVTPETAVPAGLPPHVNVQSTPAFILSLIGTIETVAVLKTGNWLAVAPLEYVVEIAPAFVFRPLPQPERSAVKYMQIETNASFHQAESQQGSSIRNNQTRKEHSELSDMVF